MLDVLIAMSAIFLQFQAIFQDLLIFIGKIISPLALGALELD
jgi:hypothetical protein